MQRFYAPFSCTFVGWNKCLKLDKICVRNWIFNVDDTWVFEQNYGCVSKQTKFNVVYNSNKIKTKLKRSNWTLKIYGPCFFVWTNMLVIERNIAEISRLFSSWTRLKISEIFFKKFLKRKKITDFFKNIFF